MTITGERQFVSISLIQQWQQDGLTAREIVNNCKSLRMRNVNPPPPPGSISIGAASRKYGLNRSQIHNWVEKGTIPEVLRTTRYRYIDEAQLAKQAKKYKENPGQGKHTVKSSAHKQEDAA